MRRFDRENMGAVDQWLRLATGFVLMLLAATHLIGPWGYVGLLPMATAMFRYCPLYHALGIHTGRWHHRQRH